MIFAAGLGTRLYPITKNIPKALVEVAGKPMIEYVIRNLISAGVDDIIINVHHFPEKTKAFIESKNHFNINICFSEETDQVLETGGGLKKAAWFFSDGQPFFVHNTDILTNLNLSAMMDYHQKQQALATLFVKQRNTSRYLLFDNNMQLCGWENKKTNEKIISRKADVMNHLAFNGIHVINPKIFDLMDMEGSFSIIPMYLELAKKFLINGYKENNAAYLDIGKPDTLKEAEVLIAKINKLRD